MRILALDLSLTAAGWAEAAELYGVLSPPKGKDRGVKRLAWFADEVAALAKPAFADHAELVVIEGYAFSKGNEVGASELRELGGVVKITLHDLGIPFVVVSPSSLKKFATGKGNASKPEVLTEAVRRLGYTGHSTDEADALWLLLLAKCRYGAAVATNEKQREAIAAVAWPMLQTPVGVPNPNVRLDP